MIRLRGKDENRTRRARELRRTLTPAEFRLWSRIRSRQLGGCKFVRQEPIGRYYIDFVCREQRLIIEVDGGQHSDRLMDRARDQELRELGYRVMRIWNNDVVDNLDGVLQAIAAKLEKLPLTPALSPLAGLRYSHIFLVPHRPATDLPWMKPPVVAGPRPGHPWTRGTSPRVTA